MTTSVLDIPEIVQSQGSKHITHNLGLRWLESGVRVLSRSNGGPPGSPSDGDAYIVDSGTGDWSGFSAGDIAFRSNGGWYGYTPPNGMRVAVVDETIMAGRPMAVVKTASGWQREPGLFSVPTLSKSAAYTVTTADLGRLITVDTSGGAVTISLPAAAAAGDGAVIAVAKVTDDANAVTIDADGSEEISGEGTVTLEDQWASTQLTCDGSQWVAFGGGGSASFPFLDSNNLFANDSDPTKILKFALASIASGATRTATWPDKSGTVAMLDDVTGGGNASNEFDEDSGTSSGTTWGYEAGSFRVGHQVYDLAAGTITITANSTNYIYIDVFTQTVTHNTTGFPYGSIPLREVVTDNGSPVSQTSSTDKRAWLQHAPINDTLEDHGTVSSGTETVDYRDGKVHKIQAGGDFTLAHNNWPASGTPGDLEIVAVNWGAHTVTLPGSWNWGDAGAPTFSSSGRDRIILRTDDGGTTIDAMLAGSGF